MAGARALWRANGLKEEQFGKPIIAIVNSFTQFVPGHVHLHEIGQQVKAEIEKLGCFAAEFNTIAIDDGIAMGHDGMLYSLPSRDIIADSVEYMVNAHKADAMVCISNCDKITPGMLMASMRLNIPTIFVSGGPDIICGGFASQVQRARQYTFLFKTTLDGLFHRIPYFSQVVPYIGIFAFFHVFPVTLSGVFAPIQNFGHAVHAIYFRAFNGSLFVVFGQCTSANAVNGPVFKFVAISVERNEVHSVGVER
jgi:hypothetical protein